MTDKINLSGPQTKDLKYTINQVFDLHDPLDTIPLSKLETDNVFLPPTDKITLELLKQYFKPIPYSQWIKNKTQ